MIVENESSGYDIDIRDDLFDKKDEAEKAFKDYFEPNRLTLEGIYKEMLVSEQFRGAACEGYLEAFEILLEYHKVLVKELPGLYKTLDNYKKSLSELKGVSEYKNIKGK